MQVEQRVPQRARELLAQASSERDIDRELGAAVLRGDNPPWISLDTALRAIEAALTPSVLAESTSNDCLLVAEGWQEEAAQVAEEYLIPIRRERDSRIHDTAWNDAVRQIASAIRGLDLSDVGVG
jgi:hypothetical protein